MSAESSLGAQFGDGKPVKLSAHVLQCDAVPPDDRLPAGVKKERPWSCTGCGQKYFGYDNYVRKAHTEHRKALKG